MAALIDGRGWLFGEYDYYVDTSHLSSVIQYCPEVSSRETLERIREMCAYGERLSQQFHFGGQPPFEDPFLDSGKYVQALLGEDVDNSIAHFREKTFADDPEETGPYPAEMLVRLLMRLDRFEEAVDVSVRCLRAYPESTCPSALQLCHMAGNHARLKDLAKERGDVLSYFAASLRSR